VAAARVSVAALLTAAVLLSAERIAYVWIWRNPDRFRAASQVDPVGRLRLLFYAFKGIQLAVFVGWCYVFSDGALWPPPVEGPWLVLGASLIAGGQLLNWSVFQRLGDVGVFYGNRFGYDVPWCTVFPYSLLEHPQYVGAVLSIWGFFLVMRFPQDDWCALPILETAYYVVGSHLERQETGRPKGETR
jgi:phosphatidyl-N-methylethanolamine N-methyltransferase